MSASYFAAELALNKHLMAIEGIPAIAWEAVKFTPPNGMWVRPTLLPAEPNTLTIGTHSVDEFRCVYKISLFGPNGSGAGDVIKLADKIIQSFRTQKQIKNSDINITITKAWRTASILDDKHMMIPVNISIAFIG